jgi:hypothetical protein
VARTQRRDFVPEFERFRHFLITIGREPLILGLKCPIFGSGPPLKVMGGSPDERSDIREPQQEVKDRMSLRSSGLWPISGTPKTDPHPEEPRSGVSKDGRMHPEPWFETALARLLTMRATYFIGPLSASGFPVPETPRR